jgi:hypothetical protein
MAKNVQLTVDIKGGDSVGKAAEKTKTLKQELRELKNELASGSLTGKAFDDATARAAKLSDTIIDVNNRVKALATDGADVVLKGFGDMATGIVGGFAAAQGAMALFGSENEDLQKTLVKLQGATALLNGLQQVNATLQGDSAAMVALNTAKTKILTFVQTRYAAAVGTSTGALKLMRIAGAALGIGLIVAAIGLLIANFDKVKKVVFALFPGLEKLGLAFTIAKNAIMDFLGMSSEMERQLEKQTKANEKSNKETGREIALLESLGGKEREIFLLRNRQLRQDEALLLTKQKKIKLTDEEKEALAELQNQIRITNNEEVNRQKEVVEKDAKAKEEKIKKAKEIAEKEKKLEQEIDNRRKKTTKEIIDRQLKDFDDRVKKAKEEKKAIEDIQEEYDDALFQKELDAQKKYGDLIEQRRIDDLSIREKELFDISEKYRIEQELALGNATLLAEIETDKNNALALKKKEFAEQDAAIQKEIDLVRLDAITSTANQASQLLNQVAGKNKALATSALAVEKGAAIADVIIKGIRERAAITLRYAGNLPAATPELVLSKVRTGIAVASIAASGIQGARSISTSGGSGGGSVQPPNIRGSQTTNEPTSQPATKVFVTETDIRSSLRKVDGIYSQSTII